MADGIDVLMMAANAAKERRKESFDRQDQLADSMVTSMQKNRQLGLMGRQVNVEEQTLDLKAQTLELEKIKSQRQSDLLNSMLNQGENGMSGLPPGTTMQVGGFRIPVNQKLTEAEQSSVAGIEKFEPLVKQVGDLIDTGVLGDGAFQRTYNQFLAEGGGDPIRRVLTKDSSDLEKLASSAAELQKFAFSEGGKQLSPTEQKVVKAGLSFIGKSNEQIKTDFSAAIDILRQKKGLALGGANSTKKEAAKEIPDGTKGTAKDGTPVVRKGGKWVKA